MNLKLKKNKNPFVYADATSLFQLYKKINKSKIK